LFFGFAAVFIQAGYGVTVAVPVPVPAPLPAWSVTAVRVGIEAGRLAVAPILNTKSVSGSVCVFVIVALSVNVATVEPEGESEPDGGGAIGGVQPSAADHTQPETLSILGICPLTKIVLARTFSVFRVAWGRITGARSALDTVILLSLDMGI